jgi:MFS family permease
MFPYLQSVSQANIPVIFTIGVLMSGFFYSASNGVWPSFYAEMFSTRVRLSGMAIGTQIGFALGGFAPSIAAAIQGAGPDGWRPVAYLTLGACLLAAASAFTARETYRTDMGNLGKREAADSPAMPG